MLWRFSFSPSCSFVAPPSHTHTHTHTHSHPHTHTPSHTHTYTACSVQIFPLEHTRVYACTHTNTHVTPHTHTPCSVYRWGLSLDKNTHTHTLFRSYILQLCIIDANQTAVRQAVDMMTMMMITSDRLGSPRKTRAAVRRSTRRTFN